MKIGDLIKWDDKHHLNKNTPPYLGIIVDGPREGTNGTEKAVSFEVAWFSGELQRGWHNDYCLELMSDCYISAPDDLRGNEV
jgi:hypothetical protein